MVLSALVCSLLTLIVRYGRRGLSKLLTLNCVGGPQLSYSSFTSPRCSRPQSHSSAARPARQRAEPAARRNRLALRAPAQRPGRQGSSENWSLLVTLLHTARFRGIGTSFRFEYEIRPPILR